MGAVNEGSPFGALKDTVGENAANMHRPLVHDANFGHLEAEFYIENGEKFDSLLTSLRKLAKEAAEKTEEA